MRTIYKISAFFGLFIMVACRPPMDYHHSQDKTLREYQHRMDLLKTCDKKPNEMIFDSERIETLNPVHEVIPTKNIDLVDCEGQIKGAKLGPDHYLEQYVSMAAPPNLTQPVNYILISNQRTCAIQKIDATSAEVANVNILKHSSSALTKSGDATILIAELDFKLMNIYLNIHEGRNIIDINYYGRCLVYNTHINKDFGDAINCQQAELLGQKQAELVVSIDRPASPDRTKQSICTKPH